MPTYAPADPIEFVLPSTATDEKPCKITGPAPNWGLAKTIDRLEKQYVAELGEATGFQQALMEAWLTHKSTSWNLLTPAEEKYELTMATVDEVLRDEDIEALAEWLTKHFRPQLWAVMQAVKESAEKNGNGLFPLMGLSPETEMEPLTLMPSSIDSNASDSKRTPADTSPSTATAEEASPSES